MRGAKTTNSIDTSGSWEFVSAPTAARSIAGWLKAATLLIGRDIARELMPHLRRPPVFAASASGAEISSCLVGRGPRKRSMSRPADGNQLAAHEIGQAEECLNEPSLHRSRLHHHPGGNFCYVVSRYLNDASPPYFLPRYAITLSWLGPASRIASSAFCQVTFAVRSGALSPCSIGPLSVPIGDRRAKSLALPEAISSRPHAPENESANRGHWRDRPILLVWIKWWNSFRRWSWFLAESVARIWLTTGRR